MLEQIFTQFSRAGILIALRVISLASKLLLTIYITSISVELNGEYTYLNSVVFLSIFFIGSEYYNIAQRKYFSRDKLFLTEHSFFSGINLFIYLAVICALVFGSFIEEYSQFVFLLVVVEYISLEMFRYYLVSGREYRANILTVLKSFFIALILFFWQDYFRLEVILLISAFLTLAIIFDYRDIKHIKNINFKFFRLRETLSNYKLIIPFFTSSIFVQVLLNFDKLILNEFITKERLGIYGLVFTLIPALNSIFHVSLFAPSLRLLSQKKNFVEFKNRSLLMLFVSYTLIFLVLTILYYSMDLVQLKVLTLFFKERNLLVLICFISVIYNVSMIFHYILYVNNEDRLIMKISSICLTLYLIMIFFTSKLYFIDETVLLFLIISVLSVNLIYKIKTSISYLYEDSH